MKNLNILIIISFLFVLTVGCNKDSTDDSIDPSLLLIDFTEPYLEFCVTLEELLSNVDVPDEFQDQETLIIFNNPKNGIKQIRYRLYEVYSTDMNLYGNSNVEFYHNQQNFSFIKNWLTNKYGPPEPSSIETHLDSYVWYNPDIE